MRVACSEKNVGGYLVVDAMAEHQVACNGDSNVKGVGEDVGIIDGAGVFHWMSHVAEYVSKNTVAAPG